MRDDASVRAQENYCATVKRFRRKIAPLMELLNTFLPSLSSIVPLGVFYFIFWKSFSSSESEPTAETNDQFYSSECEKIIHSWLNTTRWIPWRWLSLKNVYRQRKSLTAPGSSDNRLRWSTEEVFSTLSRTIFKISREFVDKSKLILYTIYIR